MHDQVTSMTFYRMNVLQNNVKFSHLNIFVQSIYITLCSVMKCDCVTLLQVQMSHPWRWKCPFSHSSLSLASLLRLLDKQAIKPAKTFQGSNWSLTQWEYLCLLTDGLTRYDSQSCQDLLSKANITHHKTTICWSVEMSRTHPTCLKVARLEKLQPKTVSQWQSTDGIKCIAIQESSQVKSWYNTYPKSHQ